MITHMNKIFNKSSKVVLFATFIYILYVWFVVFPFFGYASPPDEATSDWKFPSAPLVFALLFYPAFWGWSYIVVKNIFDIHYLRTLIYTIVYIIAFASAHVLFFIFSALILWYAILTVPVGLFLLILIIVVSLFFDVRDFMKNNELQSPDNALLKKIAVIVVCYIIIPVICLYLILVQLFDMIMLNNS